MNVVAMRLRPGSLQCSACGAAAVASCDCGAPYVPARQRAAEAIEKSPGMSNRALASDLGVSEFTVRKARGSTASDHAVEKRQGRDGRLRRAPKLKSGTAKQVNHLHRELLSFCKLYDKKITKLIARSPNIDAAAIGCLKTAITSAIGILNQIQETLS